MDNPIPQCVTKPLVYDPFGMITFGRSWEAGSEYRYGFNGKENVNEIFDYSNSIDFGARVFDTRIGRWFSQDPLMRKFPNSSPYGYVLNNPILYLDYLGKDVGVSIQANPGGGGKIVLSSTVYVTGVDASGATKKYNEAFESWAHEGKNVGSFTDDSGTWEVEITMSFVVATNEDIERIKNAQQGASNENLITIDNATDRAHVDYVEGDDPGAHYLPLNENFSKDATTKYKLGMRNAYLNESDGGNTAIHEVLHLYGLMDRYTDGFYKVYDEATGEFLYSEGTYSHPHAGYETNAMAVSYLGYMDLNLIQFTNLGIAMLKAQMVEDFENGDESAPSTFSTSRHWSTVEQSDSKVSESYTDDCEFHTEFENVIK